MPASSYETIITLPRWTQPDSPRSFWLEEALATDERPANALQRLEGAQHCDVCIVGGGYTGLWTAVRLAEQDRQLKVALIEADVCGAGASGRNGGIVVGWWWKLPTLIKLCGPQDARDLLLASLTGIDDVEAVSQGREESVGFDRSGWWWTASNPSQLDAWKETIDASEQIGLGAWSTTSPGQLASRLGSDAHLGGVLDATAGVVQPARLARRLREVARSLGVRVFERSPVTSVARNARALKIATAAGEMTCEQAVLALDSWMASLSELRRSIFTVSSDMIATEPIEDRLSALGWTDNESWSDSSIRVSYGRTTADGRIALGRGGGTLAYRSRISRELHHSRSQTDALTALLLRLYPSLSDVGVPRAWSGPVARSVVGLPSFGRLERDRRILYGAGYSGTGVAPCAVGGRILASLALGNDDEWTDRAKLLARLSTFGWLPPEPLRYVGGRIVQGAVVRKEAAEDCGRRPARVDALLAKLVPNPVTTSSPR